MRERERERVGIDYLFRFVSLKKLIGAASCWAWCQFHQRFTRAFFANILAPKITKLKHSALRLFGKRISQKNLRVKC